MLAQRKNPSVKLKHLSNIATPVFSGQVKGLKKTLEDVGVSSSSQQSSPTMETADGSGGNAATQQDSSVDLGDQASGTSGPSSTGADSELDLIEETWPGKVCAFCNLGERSQLGQGEMLRLEVGPDFESLRQSTLHSEERLQSLAANAGASGVNNKQASGNASNQISNVGAASCLQQPNIKKPRMTLKGRRTSSFDASQACSELQEELNAVGYVEEPDLLAIVEPCGYFYAHRMCATWSKGVTVINANDGLSVVSSSPEVSGTDAALIRAASLRCHLCGSFGASLSCQHQATNNASGGDGNGTCPKSFHFPCAVSCGVSSSIFFYPSLSFYVT